MKAKYIMRMLQGVDPETEVLFKVGLDRDYRQQCAKHTIEDEDGDGILSRLDIYCAKVETYNSGMSTIKITLEQKHSKEIMEYFPL